MMNRRSPYQRLKHQQCGGGIMLWSGIIGGILVGPWKLSDGINITTDAYRAYLQEYLEMRQKTQRVTSHRTNIFMRYNSSSHVAQKGYGVSP